MTRKFTDLISDDYELEDEQDEEYVVIDINSLTEDDWMDIRKIALRIYESGMTARDQPKSWVTAFVMWLEFKEESTKKDGNAGLH